MAARTVAEVIAGEAVSGNSATRFEDMKAIASVIANRAAMLGVTPQQVVAQQSEFNAYGKPMPPGTKAFVDMAERAMREVQESGPTHRGTFYATPKMAGNLPDGLKHVTSTAGHRYYTDPQNRSINTALGYRQPTRQTGAQQAINTALSAPAAPRSVPTPTFAPRSAPTLPSALANAPSQVSAIRAAGSLPPSLTGAPVRGGRIGPNTTNGVPTPSPAQRAPDPARFGNVPFAGPPSTPAPRTMPQAQTVARAPDPSRFGAPAMPALGARVGPNTTNGVPTPSARPAQMAQTTPRTAPDASRFGPNSPGQMPAAMLDRYADTRPEQAKGRLSDRVAPQSVTAGLGQPLGAAKAQNVASRLGTFDPARSAASLRTAPPSSFNIGSVVGVTPAAAAQVARAPTIAAAPTLSPGFAGRIGSPRSVEASLPVGALGGINAAARVATPTAAPRTAAMISAPAQVAVPTSRPTINAPQARTVAQAPQARPAAVAAPVAAPVSRSVVSDPWGGMRQSAPTTRTAVGQVAQATPAAPQSQGLMSRLGLTPGRIAGSVIGSAVAGPIGGLVGGFIGGRIAGPQPAAAPAAPSSGGLFSGFGGLGGLGGMNTSSSGGYGNNDTRQSGFGNAGGYSDRSGSFAGFGERDSAVGPDGGKVGGSSGKSSSSSGKSSGSSSSGKSGSSSGSSGGGKGGKK